MEGNNNKDKDLVEVTSSDQGSKAQYNMNIDKAADKLIKSADKLITVVGEVGKEAFTSGIRSFGSAAAGGAAASAAFSNTSGLPIPVRLGTAVITGGALALSSSIGAEIGKSIAQQHKDSVVKMIKESAHADTNPDRVPSPDINIIHNMAETGDITSPLEQLLRSQLKISILLCFLIIFILFLIVYYYLSSNKIEILRKYIPSSWLKILESKIGQKKNTSLF